MFPGAAYLVLRHQLRKQILSARFMGINATSGLFAALTHRAADDAGDVAPILLLFLQEGLIIVGGDCLVARSPVRQGFISLGFRQIGRGFRRHEFRFLHRPADLLFHRRRQRKRIDAAAHGAGDGIARQVVEPGSARRVLAGPLGAAFSFLGHRHPRIRNKICGALATGRIGLSKAFLTCGADLTGVWTPRSVLPYPDPFQAPRNSGFPALSQISTAAPLHALKARPLRGTARVPGDKSISHRALLLGAMATGRTHITGLLEGEDVLHTAEAVTALGCTAQKNGGGWDVLGRGVGGFVQPNQDLDFGNSGTGVRLIMGLLAGHDIRVRLIGDASLSSRPMRRVLAPLRQMGAEVEDDKETLPLVLKGCGDLIPIEYATPVPSAQVKSAVLLAGLCASGETTVVEREATRDHTERMLRHFGAEVRTEKRDGGTAITVRGDAELQGRNVIVPGDPSSAAFLTAAALIVPKSEVTIEGVLVNETRTGFYTTLREMGADVAFLNQRDEGGEPIADIRVRHSRLKGVRVPNERAPSMIDEYPVLAALAAYADGETRMDGLAELKVKESDRLAATATGLLANGVNARVDGDSLIVAGGGVRGGGMVATHMDHRIAMAFLVMGLGADRPVTVDDVTYVSTSFPEFRSLMEKLGAQFETPKAGRR